MTTETAEATEATPEGTEPTEDAARAAAEAEARAARHQGLWDRLLIPMLLPALVIGIVLLLAINVSRLFLAGGKHGSLYVVVGVTLLLLIGCIAVTAAKSMRNVTGVVLLAVIMLGTILAGGMTFSAGQPKEEAAVKIGSVPEDYSGPVTALPVQALPSLKFDKDAYEVPVGVTEIDYINQGGQHTFVFTDARYSWFELAVNATGETDKDKIQLEPGTYEVYCSVPGHKSAGMVATLTVK
jgi:plastocyanin